MSRSCIWRSSPKVVQERFRCKEGYVSCVILRLSIAIAKSKSSGLGSLEKEKLKSVLKHLMGNPLAQAFLHPVPKEIPLYYTIIKKPMDFGTIKKRVSSIYCSYTDFVADIELVFYNCCTFNQEGSDLYRIAEQLREEFYQVMEEHGLGEYAAASGVGRKRKKAEVDAEDGSILETSEATEKPTLKLKLKM